jgi:ribosomal protein S18 acetylase RimI-like enzyme
MIIEEITDYSPEVLNILKLLLPQLSKNAAAPTEFMARSIVESDSSRLLVARDGDVIYGMLTIVIFPIPSGVRAWIEDVVVDESGRGKGVGAALSEYALNLAKLQGAKTVDLTSRPSREAANRLYKRIGFEPRDTNVYRIDISI